MVKIRLLLLVFICQHNVLQFFFGGGGIATCFCYACCIFQTLEYDSLHIGLSACIINNNRRGALQRVSLRFCHHVPCLIWRQSDILNSKKFHICTCVSNFITLRHGDLTIFKMTDFCHLEFQGYKNGFFEKPMQDFLLVINRDCTKLPRF